MRNNNGTGRERRSLPKTKSRSKNANIFNFPDRFNRMKLPLLVMLFAIILAIVLVQSVQAIPLAIAQPAFVTNPAPGLPQQPNQPKAAPQQAETSRVTGDPSSPDVWIPSEPPDLDCGDLCDRRFRVIGADG